MAGIGTFLLSPDEAEASVLSALKNGYRLLDTANAYVNEKAVGRGMKKSGIPREEIFLETKLWPTFYEQPDAVENTLERLGTDYIDFGFIHCLDEASDLKAYQQAGVLDYVLELKQKGIIRHIGLSSHSPELVNKVLDLGILDMLMFSINPAYDYKHGQYAIGETDERMALYQRCEKEGVAISVMKCFSGGQLLDAAKSPFGKALTPVQCMQYALDKPAVVTVLAGVKNREELKGILAYDGASDQAKDYSILASFKQVNHLGNCVYCKHCHPCPMGLDIALINKYYDLALLGDDMAKDHYLHLEKKAGDCITCGHCNQRCPFKVDQMARMQEIRDYFGC